MTTPLCKISLLKAFLFIIGMVSFSSCGFISSRWKENVDLKGKKEAYVYVNSLKNIDSVYASFEQSNAIIDLESLKKTAESKDLASKLKPGKYKLKDKMTNNEIINMLISGKQVAVKISFNYVRTLPLLASKISKKLECDSASLMKYWSDTKLMNKKYMMNEYTLPCIFIPNTYEFYWATSAEEFTDKMYKEYEKFWNSDRTAKADKLGLKPTEVITLASIVQSEQSKHQDEWPIIASLYYNRLQQGMNLQADPTVIFAHQDFTIKRVLNKHLEIDSPYNTYKYIGLPPGPIMIPESKCIDAVLNLEKTNYVYMCAKEDFSGKHNFTASYNEHLSNARKYQTALTKMLREKGNN